MHRRSLLKAGALLTTGAGLGGHGLIARALAAEAVREERILVVFELSGGNDGLNTVVPYADDAYHALRPTIGLGAKDVLKLDDRWGLNPGTVGLQRLFGDGQLAIVHGCGYARPSFSHFTSMAYWHTGAPNSGDEYGWVGRLADRLAAEPRTNFLINIDTAQSLAVKSRVHTPVVFDEPERFQRRALARGQDRASWHTSLSLLVISLFRTIPAPAKPTTCKARFKGGSNGTARRYLCPGFHVRPVLRAAGHGAHRVRRARRV